MNSDVFQNISKIIERDSKTTTYKFALLRGVIDIIQDDSPYIEFSGDRVHFPTGLVIEKWMLYYYPILESAQKIPQINGKAKQLAFEDQFQNLIQFYEDKGGLSAFYNDLKSKGIPTELKNEFFELAKKIGDTITKMPMKYLGRSVSEAFYSIFIPRKGSPKKNEQPDLAHLIQDFGTFSIPVDYYEAFKVLGSFISGQDSILFKWAAFSVNASNDNLSFNQVMKEVLHSPVTMRQVAESKNIYKEVLQQQGKVYCVWSGKRLTTYDIDHMIPFAVWKNNDLWNLLPAARKVNNEKRDKIPSPLLIERRQDLILNYWDIIFQNQQQRFKKEIQVALLGNHDFSNWKAEGISQLKNRCTYLIENRGFEEWRP